MVKQETGWLVPSDWSGTDYVDYVVCVPDSPEWKATFKGAVYLLSRAYNYDSASGDPGLASQVGKEVFDSMANCSALIDAVNGIAARLGQGSCACQIGDDVETNSGAEGGALPDAVSGVAYEQPTAIPDRKCKSANYIHNSIRDVVNELKLNRADSYGFAGLAFVLSLVATIVGALLLGPAGLLLGAVSGSFLSMATLLFKASFSLTLLYDAITSDEDEAICALADATTSDEARAAYVAYLLANGATSLEVEFVAFLLTNNLLNLLFFAWGDSESAINSTPITSDCATCCGEFGTFNLIVGTVVSGTLNTDGVPFTIESGISESYDNMWFEIDEAAGCPCVDLDIDVQSSTGPIGGITAGRIVDCANVDVWRYNNQGYGALYDVWPGNIVFLAGTGVFQVTFAVTYP